MRLPPGTQPAPQPGRAAARQAGWRAAWWLAGALTGALALIGPQAAQGQVMQLDEQGAHWLAPAAPRAAPSVPVAAAGRLVAPRRLSARALPPGAPPAGWGPVLARIAARYDLSPAMIEAVVWQESRWRPNARSPKGARGLAQLMPATARQLGANPADPVANVEAGAHYLRQLIDAFGGDMEKGLAAYNAGPARVARAGGVPPFAETRAYVASIYGHLAQAAK